jgi:hypothetical protein
MKGDDFHAKSLKIVGLIPGSSDNALALACRGCFANVVAELLKYISLEPRLENPMDYVFIVLNSTHSQTPKHHAANSVQPSLQIEVIKELADRIASISDSELNEVVRLASDKITWNANTHTAVCDVDILLKPLLTSEVLKDHLRIKNEELTSSDVTLKHAVPQYVYDKACPFEASQLLLRGIPKQKSEVWNWMNFKEVRECFVVCLYNCSRVAVFLVPVVVGGAAAAPVAPAAPAAVFCYYRFPLLTNSTLSY